MGLDAAAVAGRVRCLRPRRWIRVIKREFASNPLGTGYGSSRFSAPDRSFRVLYAARDLATAIAEGIVRDRFEAVNDREMERSELEAWSATEISSNRLLNVVDLRRGSAFLLGIDTDAVGARKHDEGQTFAVELHGIRHLPGQLGSIDGILYSSRLTGWDCIAVFDRATAMLAATPGVDLHRLKELPAALDQLWIVLR